MASVSLKISAMQSATSPALARAVRAYERPGLFLVNGSDTFDPDAVAPPNRLIAAKGSLWAIALSAGLWAIIIGFVAVLRH